MIYLLKTKDNKEITQQTLDLFRSVEGVEITPLDIDLIKLSDFIWREFALSIDDKRYLKRIAKGVIGVIK